MAESRFRSTHRSPKRPVRVAFAAVSVVGIAVGSAACAAVPESSGDRSISIGVSGDLYVNWNPLAAAVIEAPTGQAVYDSLFYLDAENERYSPSLAKEFAISDDGLTLSITLRDDVDFVDGVHMDADGVADYFTTLFTSGGYAYGYETDKYELEVVATGEYTLEFRSQLPIRKDVRLPLMAALAATAVTSPDAIATPEVFDAGPVGSGPYVIKAQGPDSITFERNPDYWNPEAYDFDEVRITAFADRVAAFNALKAGQIDVTPLDLNMGPDAEASGFELMSTRQGFIYLYVADRGGSLVPALADVRVRQAISAALDREAINEAINQGFGDVGTEPFTADQILYADDAEGRDAYDLERARDLMAEAGYADGFDLTIPMASYMGVDAYLPVVQQSLSEIGIRVTYDTIADVFGAMADGSYPVAMGWGGYSWAWSTLPPLWGGFKDPHVDALIDTIRTSPSTDEYENALDELGEIYVDELWFVVFAQPYEIYATDDEVDVIKLNVSPLDPPGLRYYTAAD
jgi:peptide/nickel transport system substrate-binding protein